MNFESEKIEFISKDVHFNYNGFFKMRNDFLCKAFFYKDIQNARIYKGYLLKNRLILILGCSLAIYFCSKILDYGHNIVSNSDLSIIEWTYQLLNRGSMLSFWGPLILIGVSLAGIINAFRRSYIAEFIVKGKKHSFRIKEIHQEGRLDELIRFLESKNVKIKKENY